MLKMLIVFLLLLQSAIAGNGVYKSSVYAFCDSKKSLDEWTQFDIDGDSASKRAYYGTKCFILQKDIQVSSIETHWGKVSFFYGGYKLWGYREGIQ